MKAYYNIANLRYLQGFMGHFSFFLKQIRNQLSIASVFTLASPSVKKPLKNTEPQWKWCGLQDMMRREVWREECRSHQGVSFKTAKNKHGHICKHTCWSFFSFFASAQDKQLACIPEKREFVVE